VKTASYSTVERHLSMPDTSLIPLAFENQSVRVQDQDGNPWFVATDVCAALGIKNSRRATAQLEADEKGVTVLNTLGGPQETAVLSEAGVYTIALRCHGAMTPGTAPYRFRKWVTGTALPALRRGHEPSVVTGFDKDTMNALGGMMKGILRKALLDLREPLQDGALLAHHASVSRGYTAGEVLDEAGVTNRKGRRGLVRRVSDALRRYAAEKNVAVGIGRLGSNTAYIFDGSLVRTWLRDGGKAFIERLVNESQGQGKLKFVNITC
jgi:prophage antirepressor-like protein